jgi:hypothetical protein
MQFLHINTAKITQYTDQKQAYMNFRTYGLTHEQTGENAMTNNLHMTSAAPYSGLVSVISDTISPIANVVATAVIFVATKFSQKSENKVVKPAGIHAPHVAMVMVPGNFMTGPFTNR